MTGLFSRPSASRSRARAEACIPVTTAPPSTFDDLDFEPFALSSEPDAALLAALESPAPEAWRRTTQALQTLAVRGCAAMLPLALRLLADPKQRYQIHSVSAWCLARARECAAAADHTAYCRLLAAFLRS